MLRWTLATLTLTSCTTLIAPEPGGAMAFAGEFSHAELDAVLAEFVDERGRVDYAALKADSSRLDRYYAAVAASSPDSHPERFPSADHRLAYWLNAYNATVLRGVIEYYPIDSVRDIEAPTLAFFLSDLSGFFYFHAFVYGGEELDPYSVENDIVRGRFADPRIHFALNCASLGCPELPREAFAGDRLEEQLARETREFMADESKVRVDLEGRTVHVSMIFSWYAGDFERWVEAHVPDRPATVLEYVRRHVSPERAARIEDDFTVEFVDYDWGLNGR